MPVILRTRSPNFIFNKMLPTKILLSEKQSSKTLLQQNKESKLAVKQKSQLQYFNMSTNRSPLSKNRSSIKNINSPGKSSFKSRPISRDYSKKLFQKAKLIQDPNVETYLFANSHKAKSKQIRKVQSTHQIFHIQNKKNDSYKVFSHPPIEEKNENIKKKSQVLTKVSQESIYFQENSLNFNKMLVQPLKKQMIDSIKQRNFGKLNNLSESDKNFLQDLEAHLFIKKTEVKELKQDDMKSLQKQATKDETLSSLLRLILQSPIKFQSNSLDSSKQICF